MESKLTLSNILQAELQRRKASNPNYSLRSFARQLDLSASYLSKLIRGTQVASRETVILLSQQLNLEDAATEQLILGKKGKSKPATFETLQSEHFSLISDWHHFAILEACSLCDFVPTAKWLAERFSISESRAESALARLSRLGLLKIGRDGKITTDIKNYSAISESVPSSANTEHERQILLGAISALQSVSPEHRHQGSVTMAIPVSRLAEAKRRLREFRREFMQDLQRPGVRDSVYQLSISFYPVTKFTKPKNKEKSL